MWCNWDKRTHTSKGSDRTTTNTTGQYGLTDEQVEEMLLASLTHAKDDIKMIACYRKLLEQLM